MNTISKKAKIYKDASIINSTIEDNTIVGDCCDLKYVNMKPFSEFGRRNMIQKVCMGKGSYTASNCTIQFADIGNYCCISSDVNI